MASVCASLCQTCVLLYAAVCVSVCLCVNDLC